VGCSDAAPGARPGRARRGRVGSVVLESAGPRGEVAAGPNPAGAGGPDARQPASVGRDGRGHRTNRGAGGSCAARFESVRRVTSRHALLATALIGTPTAVRSQAQRFVRAGATDLMLGFSDFPETGMLELFAETVLPALGDVS